MGEEGELFILIPLGHFPPLAAAILGCPENRGMVKLGNAAPERMCEAVRPGLQGEDSWFTPYKIKLQLGKSNSGRFIRLWKMDRETAGNCVWASRSEGPRPLLGKPGPGQCERQG